MVEIGSTHWGLNVAMSSVDRVPPRRCTSAQIALAWVLAQGEDIVPIFGTKRRSYLAENLGAAEVVLTAEDLRRIDEVAPRGAAAGERYPAAMMSLVGR